MVSSGPDVRDEHGFNMFLKMLLFLLRLNKTEDVV